MYKIKRKEKLNRDVFLMDIIAPAVAQKALPGQFVILRVDAYGERIPLTIADYNRSAGIITLIFQVVGVTTEKLSRLEAGAALADFVGPLGNPTPVTGFEKVGIVGGGLGCAICYPLAKALAAEGTAVDTILGFRTQELIIMEEEFRSLSDCFCLVTDDGSSGVKGFVTVPLEDFLSQKQYDFIYAVGPLPMMKAVSALTRKYEQKTIVSMNPIMIDGTGMCGGCRLTVGGRVKFACVDGPDFDGHLVDFDEAIARSRMYQTEEREAYCRLYDYEKKS